MQVPVSQMFIGILMWSIVMLMPSLITYFKTINPVVSLLLLTMLYPLLLSFLSRSGNFWISYPVIMISSVIAVCMSLILIYAFKTTNQAVLSFVPIATFIVALTGLSSTMDMYGANVIA